MPAVTEGLVSTVLPVHNRPDMLVEAVASVLGQTYRPIELIIVDDGSTDDTGRVAEELAARYPDIIRLVQRENGGPGAAREAGRLRARGEFIQYLDSDDLLLPCKFELQVAGLRANPGCGISYGKTRHYRRGAPPSDEPWKRTGERIDTMFPAFLLGRCWSTVSPLYCRSVTDAAGPWTTLRQEEDWEHDCRVAARGVRLHHCPEFVADQRTHEGPNLSLAWRRDPAAMRDRARAHVLIHDHARRAGIDPAWPEMQRFARTLFLLARQCAAAGLVAEAKTLLRRSRQAAGRRLAKGWDYRLYRGLSATIGWKTVGILSDWLDRSRAHSQPSRTPTPHTPASTPAGSQPSAKSRV
jgi:hypothetical protein